MFKKLNQKGINLNPTDDGYVEEPTYEDVKDA